MITGTSQKTKPTFPTALVATVALVALVAGGVYLYSQQPRSNPNTPPVISPEGKAYTRNLKLSEVELKATDSAMAKALVEIIGKITNNGDRKVRLVELTCIFYDPYGQVVLRERVQVVRPKSGALAPTETKPFRMPFDSIPGSWNQAMPQLVVAQIQFE